MKKLSLFLLTAGFCLTGITVAQARSSNTINTSNRKKVMDIAAFKTKEAYKLFWDLRQAGEIHTECVTLNRRQGLVECAVTSLDDHSGYEIGVSAVLKAEPKSNGWIRVTIESAEKILH